MSKDAMPTVPEGGHGGPPYRDSPSHRDSPPHRGAASPDVLQAELDALAGTIHGRVAYAFDHPASQTRVERDAKTPFISASIIKTPILMEAFRQAAAGELDWNETLIVRREDKVGGSGVLNVLHDGLELSVMDAAVLMTVVSDNTATNMMLDRLGVASVNAFLDSKGCTVTRCIRKLYDWEAIRKGIHNIICAGEITDLLKAAAARTLITPKADCDLLAVMKKQQHREKIPHYLPKGAITATKTGSLDEVDHDCGIVYLPGGDWFALTLLTGDLGHEEDAPDRQTLHNTLAKMSLACYRYCEATSLR